MILQITVKITCVQTEVFDKEFEVCKHFLRSNMCYRTCGQEYGTGAFSTYTWLYDDAESSGGVSTNGTMVAT